jgi:hypothetical protein
MFTLKVVADDANPISCTICPEVVVGVVVTPPDVTDK